MHSSRGRKNLYSFYLLFSFTTKPKRAHGSKSPVGSWALALWPTFEDTLSTMCVTRRIQMMRAWIFWYCVVAWQQHFFLGLWSATLHPSRYRTFLLSLISYVFPWRWISLPTQTLNINLMSKCNNKKTSLCLSLSIYIVGGESVLATWMAKLCNRGEWRPDHGRSIRPPARVLLAIRVNQWAARRLTLSPVF